VAFPCWGVWRPPHPTLCPPSPAATHLHVSVHDAQVVEVHWGGDGDVRAVDPLPARCHPCGTRQAATHPRGRVTLPAGWRWLSPARRATHPAPAPARRRTGGRWLRRSARRHATARAGPRCCSRSTLPAPATRLTNGLARGAPGWQGHGGPSRWLGPRTKVTWARGPCAKVVQALGP